MMLYFVIGFCAILLTISLMDYLQAKKRLIDTRIDELIARKLQTHGHQQRIEILNLREACGVMRNLLMDFAEYEASLDTPAARLPEALRSTQNANRKARRAELCAEAEAVLRSSTSVLTSVERQ